MSIDFCVYCEKEFERSDDSTPLQDHIQECPKHPLTAAKAEIERLRSTLGALRRDFQRVKDIVDQHCAMEDVPS